MTVFMITHKMTWQAQQVRNVFYYETITGNPSSSEWQDIVDEIRADYVSEVGAASISDMWQFDGIDYREVSSPGLPSFSAVPTAGSYVGSSATDPVPAQIACVVTAKANTTKPNRVRNYFAGITEAHVADGLINQVIVDLWVALFDEQSVLNALGTNELQRVAAQWNTTHTQVVAYNNVAASPGVGNRIPATQRRRRIGVGM